MSGLRSTSVSILNSWRACTESTIEFARAGYPEQGIQRRRNTIVDKRRSRHRGRARLLGGRGEPQVLSTPVGGVAQEKRAPSKEHGEYADRVRDFVIDTYIEPARAAGQKDVRVRAGDVDKALGYRYRRLPLICTALRSQKFMTAARVRLSAEEGPPSGASTTTTFLYQLE